MKTQIQRSEDGRIQLAMSGLNPDREPGEWAERFATILGARVAANNDSSWALSYCSVDYDLTWHADQPDTLLLNARYPINDCSVGDIEEFVLLRQESAGDLDV